MIAEEILDELDAPSGGLPPWMFPFPSILPWRVTCFRMIKRSSRRSGMPCPSELKGWMGLRKGNSNKENDRGN